MGSGLWPNIPFPSFFLRSRVILNLVLEGIDLIIWTTSSLNIPDAPNINHLLNKNHLTRKIYLPLKKWCFCQPFLTYQVGCKRKAGAVVRITKNTFKLFPLKLSVCVIRMLLTKMILTNKTPKVAALTKSVCVIWMSLMRIKKLIINASLLQLLTF